MAVVVVVVPLNLSSRALPLFLYSSFAHRLLSPYPPLLLEYCILSHRPARRLRCSSILLDFSATVLNLQVIPHRLARRLRCSFFSSISPLLSWIFKSFLIVRLVACDAPYSPRISSAIVLNLQGILPSPSLSLKLCPQPLTSKSRWLRSPLAGPGLNTSYFSDRKLLRNIHRTFISVSSHYGSNLVD